MILAADGIERDEIKVTNFLMSALFSAVGF